MVSPVKTIKTVGICTNPKCEKPIYTGDRVWKKGSDLYCQISCMFGPIVKMQIKKNVIREKEILKTTRESRIAMMQEIYERRKSK